MKMKFLMDTTREQPGQAYYTNVLIDANHKQHPQLPGQVLFYNLVDFGGFVGLVDKEEVGAKQRYKVVEVNLNKEQIAHIEAVINYELNSNLQTMARNRAMNFPNDGEDQAVKTYRKFLKKYNLNLVG